MTRREAVLAAVLFALLAAAPLVASNTMLNFLMTALIVALAAQGWNLLGGFCGQFSFGHAAFFGAGAYTAAVLQLRYGLNAWVACLCGLLAGAAVAWVIGALALNTSPASIVTKSPFAFSTLLSRGEGALLSRSWILVGLRGPSSPSQTSPIESSSRSL